MDLAKEIKRYDDWYVRNAHQQTDRYKGWMLISNDAAKFLLETEKGESLLSQNGFRWKRWSSISGDSDDENDVGIKKN